MQTGSSTVGKIFSILKKVGINPWFLVLPIFLSMIAATLEGVGMTMLIPLLKGFLDRNFEFVLSLPVLKDIIMLLPDTVTQNDRMLFGVLLGGFVGITVCRNIFKFLSTLGVRYFSERAIHHLRKTLFSRYLRFGKMFFDRTSTGHHSTVLLEFSTQALRPLLSVDKLINSIFSLIAYLIVMLSISWQLTLFTLPLFATLHFTVQKFIRRIRQHSRAIADRSSDLGKKSIEILSTIELVKVYSAEEKELDHYKEMSNQKAHLAIMVHALHSAIVPLQEIITLITVSCIFVGALYFIGRENIGSEHALIVFFYIVLNSSVKFSSLVAFHGSLARESASVDEVSKILSSDDKYHVEEGHKEFKGLKKNISISNLSFRYKDDVPVLDDVSFAMEKGKMTAIVGHTGSGKSTIINLLMRFYTPPPGSILFDGVDICEFTTASLMKQIAIVSQNTLLLNDTLFNNIAYGLENVSENKVLEAVKRARLLQYVDNLPDGLQTVIGDRGVQLSGGEKQRVSIARALLKEAQILILDEATSSLDNRTETLIQEAIDEAIKDCTAIVVAHRLSTIRNADSVVVLEDGKKIEDGKFQDLLEKHGKFFALWDEQNKHLQSAES